MYGLGFFLGELGVFNGTDWKSLPQTNCQSDNYAEWIMAAADGGVILICQTQTYYYNYLADSWSDYNNFPLCSNNGYSYFTPIVQQQDFIYYLCPGLLMESDSFNISKYQISTRKIFYYYFILYFLSFYFVFYFLFCLFLFYFIFILFLFILFILFLF